MDELNSVLAKIGGWPSVGFGLAVIVVIVVAKRVLFPAAGPVEAKKRRVQCACGWKGEVTVLKPRCPMCGRTELFDL